MARPGSGRGFLFPWPDLTCRYSAVSCSGNSSSTGGTQPLHVGKRCPIHTSLKSLFHITSSLGVYMLNRPEALTSAPGLLLSTLSAALYQRSPGSWCEERVGGLSGISWRNLRPAR